MLKLRKNNLVYCIKMFAVFFILQLLSINANAKNGVVIKKLNKASCYDIGEYIGVMGKGFGKTSPTKKLVLQVGAKRHVITQIKQWSDSEISAQLPTALTLDKSHSYILGIVEGARWVSNRDKRIVLCDTAKQITPVFKPAPPTPHRKTLTANPNSTQPEESKPDAPVVSRLGPFQQRPAPVQTMNLNGLGAPPSVDVETNKNVAEPKAMEPNEVVVVTATLDEATALAQFVQQYNIRVKRRSNYRSLQLVVTVLHIPGEYTTADVVKQLRESAPELWVDFNHRYKLLDADPRSTLDSKNWVYDMLGWTEVHRDCQPKRKLGIIDTGIAQIALIEQKNIEHKSLLSQGVKPAKMNHGTAVASLLLGSAQRNIPGLLPNATVYSAGVFRERAENQVDTTAELIVAALNWMAEEQVTVINLSFGGPRNLAVEIAISRVLEKGIVVVSAAGIDEQDEPLYPAAQEGVIAVRAIDAGGKPFSKKIQGDYIDFSAPGVDLWLLNEKGDGRYLSGSSFAAPIVSASYALLNNNVSANDSLKNTVRDLGESGKDKHFGWGLILVHDLCR